MWPKICLILWAVILSMDIPWVLLNKQFGIYKGFVNGIVSNRLAVGALWLIIAFLLAFSVTGILYYVPLRHAVNAAIFFGFTVYFIFNTTSLSMFRWSILSALGDTVWGALLCGIAGLIGLELVRKWRRIDPAVVNPAAL